MPDTETAAAAPAPATTSPEASAPSQPVAEAPAPDPLESKLAGQAGQIKGLQSEVMKREARLKERESELSELRTWKEELMKLPPLERIKRVDADYGKLTADLLKSDEPQETDQERAVRELSEWKTQREEAEAKAAEDANRTQSEQHEAQLVETIHKALSEREDTPIASALGAGSVVLADMRAWAKEHGQSPPPDVQVDIAKKVEARLQLKVLDQLKSIADRSKSDDFRKQIRDLFAIADEEQPRDGQAGTSRKRAVRDDAPSPTTLTNSMGNDAGARKAPEVLPKSQRRAQLMERLKREGLLA